MFRKANASRHYETSQTSTGIDIIEPFERDQMKGLLTVVEVRDPVTSGGGHVQVERVQ